MSALYSSEYQEMRLLHQQPRDISFGAAAKSLTKIFTGLSEWQQQQQSDSRMGIEEQATVVDAYEWVAKYSSEIIGFFHHESWHDLAMVDLATTLRQAFSEKINQVGAAGTQLMGDLAKRNRGKPCLLWCCTNPLNCTELHRPMGDRNGTCRAIAEFRHGADPILQDACDTHARVTRAKLIEVCRIPLELKAEIDLKLEHRRTRTPELLQVLPNWASSGATAVATVAVAGKAGDVGGLRVVLAVSGRNIDAPLPLGQIEPNESHEDGMRPLYLVAQWLAPADASRLMRVHKCSRGSMMVLAKRMISGATVQSLNSAFYSMPRHVPPSLRRDWLRRARLAARLPGVVKHGWTHQAVLACRSSSDNAELLASRIFGDAADAAADADAAAAADAADAAASAAAAAARRRLLAVVAVAVAAAADDEDDDDDDDDDNDDDDDDDDNDDDDNDDDSDNDGNREADEEDKEEDYEEEEEDVRRQYVDSTGVERTYVERHLDYDWDSDNGDNGDDDDTDDDEMKYGNAAADCLLSEAVAQQHEGCGEDDECNMDYGDKSCDSEDDGTGGYGDDE